MKVFPTFEEAKSIVQSLGEWPNAALPVSAKAGWVIEGPSRWDRTCSFGRYEQSRRRAGDMACRLIFLVSRPRNLERLHQ